MGVWQSAGSECEVRCCDADSGLVDGYRVRDEVPRRRRRAHVLVDQRWDRRRDHDRADGADQVIGKEQQRGEVSFLPSRDLTSAYRRSSSRRQHNARTAVHGFVLCDLLSDSIEEGKSTVEEFDSCGGCRQPGRLARATDRGRDALT